MKTLLKKLIHESITNFSNDPIAELENLVTQLRDTIKEDETPFETEWTSFLDDQPFFITMMDFDIQEENLIPNSGEPDIVYIKIDFEEHQHEDVAKCLTKIFHILDCCCQCIESIRMNTAFYYKNHLTDRSMLIKIRPSYHS